MEICRGRRGHCSLELSSDASDLEGGSGFGRREYGRPQACDLHQALGSVVF